jgi:hypothetical protein
MPLFSFFNTQTMHIKPTMYVCTYIYDIYTTALLRFPKKLYTLVRFEPGSSIPEADAMSIEPRSQEST